MLTTGAETLAKKQPTGKKYGTLIRVTEESADAIRKAANFEGMSIAEFFTAHLLPVTNKRYGDAVRKEARKIDEKEK